MGRKGKLVVKATMPVPGRMLRKLGVDGRGEVQRFVTSEVAKLLPRYMPLKTGKLRKSVKAVDATTVKASGDYARAQYFGVTKSGRPFDYDLRENPRAGAHWDRRLVAEQGASIAKAAKRHAARKGHTV